MNTRPAWRFINGSAMWVKWSAAGILALLAIVSCIPGRAPTEPPSMVNPASAFCQERGHKLEIRTGPDGGQFGVCIFADGTECDEWAYFRGECGPENLPPPTLTPATGQEVWSTYRNVELGYSFQYPPGADLIPGDDPLDSLIVSGYRMSTESWNISHPAGRDEFRPPEGADLEQWLTDHNMLGEKRMPDEQIAGMTAIHFRHERSPQSYADDRYYFIRGTQLYLVLIGHGEEEEDWDLNNRFLQSITFDP